MYIILFLFLSFLRENQCFPTPGGVKIKPRSKFLWDATNVSDSFGN